MNELRSTLERDKRRGILEIAPDGMAVAHDDTVITQLAL
jgi:hypothetical protein